MRCRGCGAEIEAGTRFCAQCGSPVTQAAKAPQTPQVTAVSFDLAGASELAQRLGAEEFDGLVRRYHEAADRAARRVAADVGAPAGFATLIRFGLPEPRRDDAERAVRVALDIAAAVAELDAQYPPDVLVAATAGIHTAPGDDDPSRVAAALRAIAAPGTVLLSDATLGLVRGQFVTEDLGSRSLDGSGQVHVHRAVQPSGVRSRLDAGKSTLTPLVNRDADLPPLLELWERARAGDGQTVLITGEPGVGKTRLVYEFRERARESAHSWLECACSAYTQHSAFRPVVDLAEQGLGFRDGDEPAERVVRIETAVAQLGIAGDDAVTLLAQVLAIGREEGAPAPDASPAQQRRRTLELFTELALGLAGLQPTIILAEDLQWADPSSLEMFERLIEHGGNSPLLLIGTARPEFETGWRSESNFTRLDLTPLAEDEVAQLVRRLSPGTTLPDAVVEHVAQATEGIPLFAEEMGKTLLGSGVLSVGERGLELTSPLEELDVPVTLYDSLMARLDRISRRRPAAKRVAQRAAVIGREFDQLLVEQVVGLEPDVVRHGLARLVEDDLLVQHGEPPTATYTYRHALIQDAAYHSLLKLQRRELHARTAEALEARRRIDVTVASPEAIARHYEAAGHTERAVDLYRQAADEAVRQSAHREAIAHFERAIGLIRRLPGDRVRQTVEADLQTTLGSSIIAIRGYGDPAIEKAYQRAHELYDKLGDKLQVGYTLAGLSLFYFNHGEVQRGAQLATRALAIARDAGDDALRVLASVQIAVPTFYQGEFSAALERVEEAGGAYDLERHRWLGYRFGADQGVAAHCFAALSLMRLGRPDTALRRARAAVGLARELKNPYDLAYALFFETAVHWNRGDAAAQGATAAEVLAVAEPNQFELFIGLGRMFRAAARVFTDGGAAALEELYEGSGVAAATGFRGGLPAFVCLVAEAQKAAGLPDDALGMADVALAAATETGQPYWDAELHRLKGELLLEHAEADQGEAELRHGLEIAQTQQAAWPQLRAAVSLARLLREQGKDDAAIALLAPVHAQVQEGRDTPLLQAAATLLGSPSPAAPGP